MVAALKFFLGQDEAADNESDDESDEDEFKAVQPSKQEIYNANKKVGTATYTVHPLIICIGINKTNRWLAQSSENKSHNL